MKSANRILRVVLPTPLWRCFDYLPLANMQDVGASIGCRIKVSFGRRQLVGLVVDVVETSEVPSDKLKRISALLDEAPLFSKTTIEFYRRASKYYHYPLGEVIFSTMPKFIREGQISEVMLISYCLTPLGQGAIDADYKRAPKQRAFLEALKDTCGALVSTNVALQGFDGVIIKKLLQKQWIQEIKEAKPPAEWKASVNKSHDLNEAQAHAVKTLLAVKGAETICLEGVTGSGKTEVYLQTIAKKLEAGQQVLVLVPEIGLTPQTVSRFQKRFNVPVGVLHSDLPDGERMRIWFQAARGELAIVIGTRSAVFAPFMSLGLIILDEEHDTSFKQQSGFRYSARDLAVLRGHLEACPVILGSATPSLETLHNVNRERYSLLQLPERAGGASKPVVRFVNLCDKDLIAGVSDELFQSMGEHLSRGNQVLLFLNRRGFAPVLMCHHCGWVATCKHCDARMTLHFQPRQLFCHHCGYVQQPPRICGSCNQSNVIPIGLGTEQLEDELLKHFPKYKILRVDRDAVRGRKKLEATFQKIHDREADILIGTQMLAKGHHFPHVTLAAIVDADGGLYSADFRAVERMAQLLVQVSGRAGREEKSGEVIIQTHHPDHPLLKILLDEGYRSFAEHVLKERAAAGLPPYTYFALLRAEGKHREYANEFLTQARQFIPEALRSKLAVMGPVPAAMERKAGRYRAMLLMQSDVRGDLQAALRPLSQKLDSLSVASKVRWSLDVDPLEVI